MDNQEVLRVEHVGKDYMLGAVTGGTLRDAVLERLGRQGKAQNKPFTALKDVSFSVKRGEAIGLIGSNGAGKSTLLKLISRITAPTRGRILINGRVSSMLEVGTGFHQELTGRENIYLNGSILGMSRAEIDKKIDSIIEFSECQNFIDTPVKRYSSGMYVKLAFAVASHLDSEILIMDEVLAVGDVKFQQKCLNKMKEVAETEGRTILYVSHNMDTIHKLCNRCIVLDHGSVAFDGDVLSATKIYLGDNLRREASIDLSQYLRPGWLGRDDVRLIWAEYPNRQDSIVQNGMDLKVRWRYNADVEHLCLRVEMMDDSERPFAAEIFHDIGSGKAGDIGEGLFHVTVKAVMNGSYQTYYTLYVVDGYRETVDLDCVRGLHFTVRDPQKDIPLRWRNQSWGNIKIEEDTYGTDADNQ